jgi:hypothetical protein
MGECPKKIKRIFMTESTIYSDVFYKAREDIVRQKIGSQLDTLKKL